MIITQSTTAKRRLSVHKNLFDPSIYRLPEAPKGVFQPLRQVPNQPNSEAAPPETNTSGTNISYLPKKFVELFPKNTQHYLPEVDVKVTVVCLVWYVISSVSSNLSKAILRDFNHPVALTELQFLLSAFLCVTFLTVVNFLKTPSLKRTAFSKACNNFPEGILPTYLDGNFKNSIYGKFLVPSKIVLMTTFPMGIFQFVGHITSHKATSLIPVSLVHSIKALSPIITVGYYRIFQGRQYNPMTYYTLMPLISGVMITCWSTHGSKKPNGTDNGLSILRGLLYASISMLIFVSQNIFAKGILTVRGKRGILPSAESIASSDKKEVSPLQIDKITILFYCSCIGFLLTLPPFLMGELLQHQSVLQDLSWNTSFLIISHGMAHFLQAILAFQLIGMLSSVNYSVANIMKRIVIISVALSWESRFNLAQLVGLLMTLAGLYGYDKWGISKKINYHP